MALGENQQLKVFLNKKRSPKEEKEKVIGKQKKLEKIFKKCQLKEKMSCLNGLVCQTTATFASDQESNENNDDQSDQRSTDSQRNKVTFLVVQFTFRN